MLPVGDASLPFGACGSLVTATPSYPVDDRYHAVVALETDEVPSGEAVPVQTFISSDEHGMPLLSAVPASGPQIAIARDGVVVAVSTTGTAGHEDLGWQLRDEENYAASSVSDWLAPVVCASEGQSGISVGAPLPAGTYTVLPFAEIVDLGADRSVLEEGYDLPADADLSTVGTHGTALGGTPLTLVISGDDAEALAPTPYADAHLVPVPDVGWPTCGAPAPVPTESSLRITTPASGTTVAVQDLDEVASRLEYVGPGRMIRVDGGRWATVVQDGVVVGTSFSHWDGGYAGVLGAGLPSEASTSTAGIEACVGDEDGDAPLTAGSYTVFLHAFVLPVEYQLPDGSTVDASVGGRTGQWTFVYADPFTLVVD